MNSLMPDYRLLSWLPKIDRTWKVDLIAGLTLWGFVVPESIAYAGLAGVQASAGLYTIIFAVALFSLFGSSLHLIASPTSATAATAAVAITSSGVDAGTAMAAITIAVGLFFLISALFRLDFVVKFISRPVNEGFIFGLSLFVSINQLPKILGIEKPGSNALQILWKIPGQFNNFNYYTIMVGLLALAGLFGIKKLFPKVPEGLVVLAVGMAASTMLSLSNEGVAMVGAIPTGLPKLSFPSLSFQQWGLAFSAGLGILLVAMSEALSTSKSIASDKGYKVNTNQDLFGLGIGSIVSGLFGGMVGAGSMSSSSVNEQSGAKTPLSGLIASGGALLTALFLGGLFKNLPEAILAGLIIHAVSHHLLPSIITKFRSYSVVEYRLALVSFAGVILTDALFGLIFAMLVNLIYLIYKATDTKIDKLGTPEDDPNELRRCDYHKSLHEIPNSLAYLPTSQLFYANVSTVAERITDEADKYKPSNIILNFDDQLTIDFTTATTLLELRNKLARKNITFYITHVPSEAKSCFERIKYPTSKPQITSSYKELKQYLNRAK